MAESKERSGKGKGTRGKAPRGGKAAVTGKRPAAGDAAAVRKADKAERPARRKTGGRDQGPAAKPAGAAKTGKAVKAGKTPKVAKTARTSKTAGPSKARKRPARPAASSVQEPAEPHAPVVATPASRYRSGYALVALSAAAIASALYAADPLAGGLHLAGRVVVQGVCAVLIALFLWSLASRWRKVPYVIVLGVCGLGLFAWDAALAWRVDRARVAATPILAELEAGSRSVESLTRAEKGNPYIEAYLVMRDVYWELSRRADEGMSRYRSRFEEYTADGAFLDAGRLRATADLQQSMSQIEDLQRRLSRIESAMPDLSDLLLTVELLEVDAATRAAYAGDLHQAREALVAATAAVILRERESLRAMRQALEVLLEAEGHYRIDRGEIIFDRPDDAARFTGKADRG